MRKSALFGAKTLNFSKIIVRPQRTRWRRVEPVRTFCRPEGRGSIFCEFVRTSFMDGPLSKQGCNQKCFKQAWSMRLLVSSWINSN